MSVIAIIIACGKQEEIAPGTEAAFLTLGSGPILSHSLKTLEEASCIDRVIVVVSKERVDAAMQIIRRYGCTKVRGVVIGGASRMSSLRTVFSKMPSDPSVVVIHEASRPFLSKKILAETVKGAKRYGSSIAAHKVEDSVKIAPKGMRVGETLDRNTVWTAQTPQAFKINVIKSIVETRNKGVKLIDDESALVTAPAETHLVEAGWTNMKIRSRHDLEIAAALLHARLVGDVVRFELRETPAAV
ncbi:2-C-methyl-D-erythritol 4-phosphate cytidylyltransferase [Pontiella sp.]|uniref:IspD/TarI family cytidylyltransferase n=1 Tax=Pontiella sp. TaxID=2837462 RepID=UPI003568D5BC